MKRQKFHLGSVLKHYEIQKQRAEQELHHASRLLREIDDEINAFHSEIDQLARYLGGIVGSPVATDGWVASCRKSEHLGQQLREARVRRERQADVVARCDEKRKRWAIAEETLASLRHKVELANEAEETKVQQLLLQEAILRRWLGDADQSQVA
jgi:hypothetical protein